MAPAVATTATGTGTAEASAPAAATTDAEAKTSPVMSRKAVKTPADIARQRELERDRPAPIDRGPGISGQPAAAEAAAAAAVAVNTGGEWAAPSSWPINAIHAVLTPDGKVMSYGTDPSGAQGAQLYYDVWTPTTNAHSLLQHTVRTDLFCTAQTVLPSGQVLLAGGDTRGVTPNQVNGGVADVNFYDPVSSTITAGPPMAYARWYGSAVPLADGRALMLAGIDGGGAGSGVPEKAPSESGKTSAGESPTGLNDSSSATACSMR